MSIERYPLTWPAGWKRTAPIQQIRAQFYRAERTEYGHRPGGRLSVADALTRIANELRRLGVTEDEVIVSTNLRLRIDGLPRGDQAEPDDTGAAVYWLPPGAAPTDAQKCMAIDRYDRVADNLGAIAATLEALRAIERHGGGAILERAFQGFTALPERAGGRGWRDVLKFSAQAAVNREMIKDSFRILAKQLAPDHGGNRDDYEELIWARDAALREVPQ